MALLYITRKANSWIAMPFSFLKAKIPSNKKLWKLIWYPQRFQQKILLKLANFTYKYITTFYSCKKYYIILRRDSTVVLQWNHTIFLFRRISYCNNRMIQSAMWYKNYFMTHFAKKKVDWVTKLRLICADSSYARSVCKFVAQFDYRTLSFFSALFHIFSSQINPAESFEFRHSIRMNK